MTDWSLYSYCQSLGQWVQKGNMFNSKSQQPCASWGIKRVILERTQGDWRPMGGEIQARQVLLVHLGSIKSHVEIKNSFFFIFYPLIMGNDLESFKLCMKQRHCWEVFALLFVQGTCIHGTHYQILVQRMLFGKCDSVHSINLSFPRTQEGSYISQCALGPLLQSNYIQVILLAILSF